MEITIPEELVILLILSMVLSILLFRTNYRSNLKASRSRYSENGRFSYLQLWLDIIWAVLIGAMGCVGTWHAMDTWDWLESGIQYKYMASVVIGGMMQQLVPIGQELVMGQARNVASRFKAGDYSNPYQQPPNQRNNFPGSEVPNGPNQYYPPYQGDPPNPVQTKPKPPDPAESVKGSSTSEGGKS